MVRISDVTPYEAELEQRREERERFIERRSMIRKLTRSMLENTVTQIKPQGTCVRIPPTHDPFRPEDVTYYISDFRDYGLDAEYKMVKQGGYITLGKSHIAFSSPQPQEQFHVFILRPF